MRRHLRVFLVTFCSAALLNFLACESDAPATPDDAGKVEAVQDTTPTETLSDASAELDSALPDPEDTEETGEAAEPLPRTPGGLPLALPFSLTRETNGAPLTEEEIALFTKRITGLLKQMGYYTWVYETTHGVDASTGLPDWVRPDFARASGLSDLMREPLPRPDLRPPARRLRFSYLRQSKGIQVTTWDERNAARFGMTYIDVWSDRRLVEFVLSIPQFIHHFGGG